jgi:hypothetical protein
VSTGPHDMVAISGILLVGLVELLCRLDRAGQKG